MSELVVLLNSEPIGIVRQVSGGDLRFTYEAAWRDRADAYPLSLSIPLTRREHPDSAVRPFLEGLLPDNQAVLEGWARAFHVSARNPFALLQHMGEDCAGAVQFVVPKKLDRFLDPAASKVEWLSEKGIAERLRDLVEGHGTGRFARDRGHFSLAGAQPKTALFHAGGRWGIPSGVLPTTHILKPPARQDLEAFEINEHFCLKLAENLGLEAAESTVQSFDGQPAIVVTRYDRSWSQAGKPIRLHQEDSCQALAIPPLRKYEADGGPGAASIIRLLINESTDPAIDVGAFLDALALNWAIGGTDSHAKNYSLLIGLASIRLAPLYDIVSALPYRKWIPHRKVKLAMRIGREYHVWKISSRHWAQLAEVAGLDRSPVLQRVGEVLEAIPNAVARSAEQVRQEGFQNEIVDLLEERIAGNADDCRRRMT